MKALNGLSRLKDLGIYDGTVFHLHAVEDTESMKLAASKCVDTFALIDCRDESKDIGLNKCVPWFRAKKTQIVNLS